MNPHTQCAGKQRRKKGCWEPLNKKTFLERSSWAGKQRREVTWRCIGGNLRVTSGVMATPMEQSRSHTFDKHSQGPPLCTQNRPSVISRLADIRVMGMFFTHVAFPSEEWTSNLTHFIKGCFWLSIPINLWTCDNLVTAGRKRYATSLSADSPAAVKRWLRIYYWQVSSQTQWWWWLPYGSPRAAHSWQCVSLWMGYCCVYRKFLPHGQPCFLCI